MGNSRDFLKTLYALLGKYQIHSPEFKLSVCFIHSFSLPPQGRLEADQVLVARRHGKDIDRREGVAGKSNKDRGMLVGMDRCFLGVADCRCELLIDSVTHRAIQKCGTFWTVQSPSFVP